MILSIVNLATRTVIAFALLSIVSSAWGASFQPNSFDSLSEDSTDVVATVAGHKIHSQTVRHFIDQKIGKHEPAAGSTDLIRAHALEHLVRRAIVREFLVEKKYWVGENVVRLAVERLTAQLKRADVTLDQHLQEKQISREQLDFETAWRISWKSYLDKVLTDRVLENYFDRNRVKFDGTQLRVAHLLIRPSSDSNSGDVEIEKLNAIRDRLQKQPLDWNKLVAKNSEAASKDQRGRVGWIGIDGPMPPNFTTAAFKLDVGEVSPPVKTKFGWHLVKCLEMKPGKKGPQDARAEVLASAKQELFFKISKDQRNKSEIRYSGNWPHLDESGNLAQ